MLCLHACLDFLEISCHTLEHMRSVAQQFNHQPDREVPDMLLSAQPAFPQFPVSSILLTAVLLKTPGYVFCVSPVGFII